MSEQEPKVSRPKVVLAAMTAANAMLLIDQTAVPLTLPDIMDEFHVGAESAQWVVNASLLMLAGLLVLGGRLGDQLGRRKVFIVGAALFAGASAVGGLAPEFGFLLAARAVQGVGGALMLPVSVAIVGASFSSKDSGRALGTMGGIAAVAGALGPTIGGVLTSALSWRFVLLVNVPLAIVCVVLTLRSVPADEPRAERVHIDISGSVLLCIALIGLVFGLSQTQSQPFDAVTVYGPVTVGAVAAAAFLLRERRARNPLMDLSLLRRSPNYLGATLSQGVAGMLEMGLGVIFPLVLILNLGMSPALAGLALIPTTVPMVLVAPLAGRWYDRAGGRAPLVSGFAVLAVAGGSLAWGVHEMTYLWLLPGLLLYGLGLALVLTVNDPVSLDMVAPADHGQASGVSATAEQGGGAIGIALLYSIVHTVYVGRLHVDIDRSSLADLTDAQYARLRAGIEAAEQTGLNWDRFDPSLRAYLEAADNASTRGYTAAFAFVSIIALVGLAATGLLVRRAPAVESAATI